MVRTLAAALTAALTLCPPSAPAPRSPEPPRAAPAAGDVDYEADVAFALDELEKQCGELLRVKGIDWKKVRREFTKDAKKVRDDGEHMLLLQRLIARLEDGHAGLRPLEEGGALPWPEELTKKEYTGPGFSLCRVGKELFVKSAWSSAAQVGIEPGMEVVKIDGEPPLKWLEARVEELRETRSFSTDQHALFFAMNGGLSQEVGARIKLEVRPPGERKTKKRTVTYTKAAAGAFGPAFWPEGTQWAGESVGYGRTASGNAYLHVRRVREDVLKELDEALAAVGDAPGMVLDFRGNSGGGCDHDAFEGRFVPKGAQMQRMARGPLESAGPHPYGGPMVVIVDGTVVSAGETTSGMFKEDGRGYMIGESATAGMSSQKTLIPLPSKLCGLYVSTRSNRSSFNGGRGIEGIGVPPQELVEFDPEDLANGVDTLIRRAEELLADFPRKEVRYDPEEHGWKR